MNRIQKAEPNLKMYYRQGRILGLIVSRKKEAVPAGLAVICSTLGLLTGISYCIHPAIWQLYDRGRGEMLETLHVYLETGLQLSETARILGMHRNSVSYRLQCIEDLMGLQLESVSREELQLLRLSFEILNFCGEV